MPNEFKEKTMNAYEGLLLNEVTFTERPPIRTANRRRLRSAAFWGLILCLLIVTACAGQRPTIPAVTPNPTGTYHIGKFIWFDLLTDDVPAVKAFYSELFGWEFEGRQEDVSSFATIKKDGRPIGSVIYLERLDEKVSESQWLSYLSVPDVDRAVDHVRHHGGVILKKPRDLPNRGRIAIVRDPQGAVLALLRTNEGDPPDHALSTGKWSWSELWTTDVTAAASFYETLVGYSHEVIDLPEGGTYHVLMQDDRIRAGLVLIPWEEVRPNWLPYVLVSDVSSTVALAKALGGKVLIDPDPSIRDDSVAVIADPSGAVLAIQNWPLEKEERGDSQ
jgi:predicted enzyme related to lactoylglutathione lyase